jgi:hypothetical protein
VKKQSFPRGYSASLIVLVLTGCAGLKQVELHVPNQSNSSQVELDLEACKKIALEKVADVDRFTQSAYHLKESFGAAYLLNRMMESAEADTRRRLWVQSCMEERGYKYQ